MSKKADKLDFFINVIESGVNYELFFSIMRDYRLGGLNPNNYDKFIRRVRKFPDIDKRYFSPSQSISDFTAIIDPSARIRMKLFLMRHNLSDLNLQEVTTSEVRRIWKRIEEIIVDKTKFCWHPEASNSECTKDQDGNIKISRAHSIQHNKILKYISEDHQVKQLRSNEIEGKMIFPIKHASTFYGFCDKHDKLFIPIEKQDYSSTYEQNFLFAYRAHVHSAHVKLVFNEYMNFGDQVKNDIITEKKYLIT